MCVLNYSIINWPSGFWSHKHRSMFVVHYNGNLETEMRRRRRRQHPEIQCCFNAVCASPCVTAFPRILYFHFRSLFSRVLPLSVQFTFSACCLSLTHGSEVWCMARCIIITNSLSKKSGLFGNCPCPSIPCGKRVSAEVGWYRGGPPGPVFTVLYRLQTQTYNCKHLACAF